jgi:hypothetical protein
MKNYYMLMCDLLFPNFRIWQTLAHILLLFRLRSLRNLEYIRIFLMFVTALFRNIDLSQRLEVHDIIINWADSYNFQQFYNVVFIHVMAFSPHMRSIYKTSANTLFESSKFHTSSAEILNGRSLIPFWAKVNITRHSCSHYITHCTRHYTCSRRNYKMQLLECHLSVLVLFCKQ